MAMDTDARPDLHDPLRSPNGLSKVRGGDLKSKGQVEMAGDEWRTRMALRAIVKPFNRFRQYSFRKNRPHRILVAFLIFLQVNIPHDQADFCS